jgi:tripartite-type tricarboxylate transporter receptor subunit TctC
LPGPYFKYLHRDKEKEKGVDQEGPRRGGVEVLNQSHIYQKGVKVMETNKRRGWVLFFMVGSLLLMSGSALAQAKFPTKSIDVVIPFAAGGNTEINAQLLRPALQKALDVGVAIVLKPGAGTTIGMNFVANAPPDGYTVAGNTPSLLCTRYTMKSGVSYEKFDPVIQSVAVPMGVAVKMDAPWKNFKEFMEYAKANPGKVLMGNSGLGAMTHIGTTGIEMATGMKFTHMPFKGTGPEMTALIGGHIDGGVMEISALYPFFEAKKLRILAVSSPERNPSLPDVPTFREHRFDMDVGTWVTYFVPKGTPKDRIQTLHNVFKVAMESAVHKDYYKKQGGVVQYMDLQMLTAWVDGQDKLWKKIIDFGGFKPE